MAFPLPIPSALRDTLPPGCRVLVSLSGGVDSSVALALLHHLGCDVTAVTFKNFCYAEDGATGQNSCCSLEAIADARGIAHMFGAQHWVRDVSDSFRTAVIEPFVAEYAAGRTPNPCQMCNAQVRFPTLMSLAEQLGCERIATGHYARIALLGGQARLLRGIDEAKDQAYFLYGVAPALLTRLVFPLGWYRKAEVRWAAAALDLPAASKPESQEICFVPAGDRSFLFAGATQPRPGDIVDSRQRVLGRHKGLIHYTVGQRRGLGIAAAEPLYVLALDLPHNRLIVGPEPELAIRRIRCDSFVTPLPDFPAQGPPGDDAEHWLARIRHRHRGAPVARWWRRGNELTVQLSTPAQGVAPGQALVLYQQDVVCGGGRIRETA